MKQKNGGFAGISPSVARSPRKPSHDDRGDEN